MARASLASSTPRPLTPTLVSAWGSQALTSVCARGPLPRTQHVTCGSHVLTRVKVTVSEGAPWAPAAVNREAVAQALPVGPITAGSCAPESWAGTSQGVVPPFSSSQEVPVLRSPRMGQHLTA